MSFTDYQKDLIDSKLSQIKIGMIAKIVSYDKQKVRATIEPLYKITGENKTLIKMANIENVPVEFFFDGEYYIRPDYKPGVMVWCSYSERDIYKALRDFNDVQSEKLFSSENLCIMGAIAKTNWSSPSDFSKSGLIMGHKDGGINVQFTSSKLLINGGGRGVARKDDSAVSDTISDAVFWTWITGAHAILAGLGLAVPTPTSLTSKITTGSSKLEAEQ